MTTVLLIVLVALLIALLLVASVRPLRSTMSPFELERRATDGDQGAIATLRRETLLVDIIALQRIMVALLLVAFVVTSVARLGWLFGTLLAVFVALEYTALARFAPLHNLAQKLYQRAEPRVLNVVEKLSGIFAFLRGRDELTQACGALASREELEHLIAQSQGVLTPDEKKLLTYGLTFGGREVHEVMTPRSVVDSVARTELLGPLALDDLHKTGHSRFPVIDGDIDHVVGMLHVQDLLTLSKKRSVTAEKAMEPRVFYIREDQTLQHALSAFIRTHHHLFIVVNEYRETVGVLSLEDVIEALLGRKIIDEFDAHDDLRAVAARNPRGNNQPRNSTNI